MTQQATASVRVTVLVVAYHGDQWIAPCVNSLVEASSDPLHLLLVDNSGNTTLDTLQLDPFYAEVLKTDQPLGFAEANNTALVGADRLSEFVLFLNQDTISPPGWIDACIACFDADPTLGAVSPLIRTYDDEDWDPSFRSCLPVGVTPEQLPVESPSGDVLKTLEVPAPALLVRADVLRRVGPFDPVFGSYYEDYDLCRRIRAAGFTVGFARGSQARHYSGSAVTDRTKELRRMRQILRNRVIHGVRGEARSRPVRIARYALADLPRRLVRGVLRTSSSQPPSVTLGAYRDVVPLLARLSSEERDEAAWHDYLDTLGWPPANLMDTASS